MHSHRSFADPSSPAPARHSTPGLVTVPSHHSAAETLVQLEAALKQKGMHLFARIPHALGARQAGISLRPNTLLLFGNPQVGTPLLQSRPTIGIDLPLKALVWEDEAGQAWLSDNDPGYLTERHGIHDRTETVQTMTAALQALAGAATGA